MGDRRILYRNPNMCKGYFFSVRPIITTEPETEVRLPSGGSANLKCRLEAGNPTPSIRWRRRGRKLPSGDQEFLGPVLVLSEVTRHDAGFYLCLADNGFSSQPEEKEVRVVVDCEFD